MLSVVNMSVILLFRSFVHVHLSTLLYSNLHEIIIYCRHSLDVTFMDLCRVMLSESSQLDSFNAIITIFQITEFYVSFTIVFLVEVHIISLQLLQILLVYYI